MRIGVIGVVNPGVVTINTDYPAYDPSLNVVQPGAGINPSLVDITGNLCPTGFTLDNSISGASAVCIPNSPVPPTTTLQCLNGTGPLAPGQSYCVTTPPPVPPAPTIIPGVPDWAVYGVGGLLGFVLLSSLVGGHRR